MPRLSKIGAAALAAFGWTSGAAAVTADFLVVAGGGGGGKAGVGGDGGVGGGGAGGYRTGTTSLNLTLSYTVTVGAGGNPASGSGNQPGGDGNNSVFNAVTSTGGGGGGYGASGVKTGRDGGSGGGAAFLNSGTGQGNTPSTSPSQGNNGGSYSSGDDGAGGGGAGAVGGNAAGAAGAGGNGSASSITGTSVTYAGGGGGSGYNKAGGAGGTGGGGAGGSSTGNGVPGTANLGGGGGGGGAGSAVGAAGAGGSGVVIISYPSPQKFGGGIVTASGGNTIHTFTTSGTLTPLSSLTASYLIVAGGGSGADYGGGGAGGLLSSSVAIDLNSIYIVTVGAGGTGSSTGNNGSNSVFSSITATGGGKGGSGAGVTGGSGGSGGGASYTGSAGTGTVGQGNNGGTGNGGSPFCAGGGGGASAVGGNGLSTIAGAGGAGTASSISGSSVTYSGGGGGGGNNPSSGNNAAGGAGGGGTGGKNNVGQTAGTANTGGGGGGAGNTSSSGSSGGSGIVVISYAGSTQLMAGGTVTISGGNVIHTFTSSGYLTPLTLVGNSLRFRSSASAYLNRTPSVASNQKVWTWSAWVKRGSLTTPQWLFAGGVVSTDYTLIRFGSGGGNNDNLEYTRVVSSAIDAQKISTAVYRDPAAWYHIVVAEDALNLVSRVYVNGTEITYSTNDNPSNVNGAINAAVIHNMCRYTGLNLQFFDGYLADINFIDGQALTPNAFGTFNQFGVWQPIRYGGSYGTNGFYLKFNNNASTTTLGLDSSPQGNNWTTNNISVTAGSTYDSMTDVPTLTSTTAANYCVWNPLVTAGGNITCVNANLQTQIGSFGNNSIATIGVTSGKWYWEVTPTFTNNGAYWYIGVSAQGYALATQPDSDSKQWAYYAFNGNKMNGNNTAYGSSYTTNDIIGVALDMDAGTLTFYKNGTSQGQAFSNLAGNTIFPSCSFGNTGSVYFVGNFGQRPFAYTPPSGFLPLNTFNL
jgi:hypothetical protein